jgi:type I restriction-modification system DNA methylase subunit
MTNPPFGDVKGLLDNLDMFILRLRRWECLFVELCIRIANRRVAVIVPDSLLDSIRDKPLRKWILDNFGYRSTISLPRKAFWQRRVRNTTQTKTSIMIIDKFKPPGDYKIFMAIAESSEDLEKVQQAWRKFEDGNSDLAY